VLLQTGLRWRASVSLERGAPVTFGLAGGRVRFDVAFTFTRTTRRLVRPIAELVAADLGTERVLYDDFHQEELSTPRGGLALLDWYKRDSRLVVVVLSADYDDPGTWTYFEWPDVLGLIRGADGDQSVLLARTDDTLPRAFAGLGDMAFGLDIRHRRAAEVAAAIKDRLARIDQRAQAVVPDGVPNGRPSGGSALPVEILGLVRQMREATKSLPYQLNASYQVPLSGVYVRQSVATPTEVRQFVSDDVVRSEDEKGEVRLESIRVVEQRRVTGRIRPFEEVIDEHDHLVIQGGPGLGKTTLGYNLVHELAVALLDPQLPGPLTEPHIPLIIPARVLAGHMRGGRSETLSAAVASEYEMLANGEVPAEFFANRVCGLRWLVVVDALDEIPERADRERLLTALAAWMSATDEPLRLIVTTRPLAAGETARLPKAGFYELQRFDREALSSFARRWFDPDSTPDGALRAADYLDQVRLAGLEEIVAVPLLATVAAYVLQSRPGQPLPASRYDLYEQYIKQYTAARAAGRAAVLKSLTAVPSGMQFAQWLETHRSALLEGMAVAYTTSETPLLDVLRNQLGDHMPLLDTLPADWQATFADWLTQTGLFDRNRPRLRFLHQTFAEHLAASARARALPPFEPASPQWQDVIAGCLLGTSAEQQAMLHHLHLFPATGVLDWLQHGSQAARDAAGELLNQGCPVGDTQLEVYLARVADKVTAGSWTDSELRDLAGLTRHASVRTHLDGLLHRPDVGPAAKIQIVDLLRERSPDVRREAAALLRRFIADTCPHHVRRQAATVLARLAEEEEKTTAARVLYELASDAHAPYDERRQAAETLGKLGGKQRQLAATALERLVFEPARSEFQRRAAAESMGDVDVDGARAAQILRKVAADPAVSANARREAAEDLLELGGTHRAYAAELLISLVEDATAPALERALSLASVATIEPEWRPRAVEMLCCVLADGTIAAYDRQQAAATLAEFGGDCRETAAAALDAMASVPVEDAATRVQAAASMAEFGGEHRVRAAMALHDIARDPGVDLDERLAAARALSGLGHPHRQIAAEAMLELAISTVSSPANRLEAAETTAKFGDKYARRVRQYADAVLGISITPADRILAALIDNALRPDPEALVRSLATDLPRLPVAEGGLHILAAEALLDAGFTAREFGVRILRDVASNAVFGGEARKDAAEWLAGIGEEGHRKFAAAALCELAADPVGEASDRMLAARVLSKLGGLEHAQAATLAHDLALDPAVDGNTRIWAVDALRRIGGAEQELVVIRQLTADPSFEAGNKIWVASQFDPVDDDGRQLALNAFEGIALDAFENAADRVRAAGVLARLTQTFWPAGVRLLHELAASPLLGAGDRAVALTELCALGSGDSAAAVRQLAAALIAEPNEGNGRYEIIRRTQTIASADREVAAAGLTAATCRGEAWLRRAAAVALASLGPDWRPDAMAVLHDLAVDPTSQWTRAYAADDLVTWSRQDLGAVTGILRHVAADRIVADSEDRRDAAERLGKLGEEHRDAAAAALRALICDVTAAVEERRLAARALAGLGGTHVRDLVAWFEEVLDDVDHPPTERILTAVMLAGICRELGSRAVLRLRPALEAPVVSAEVRRLAGWCLVEIGGACTDRGVALLAGIAAGPGEAAERIEAATALARLGGGARARALDLLHRIARDPTIDASERVTAATTLAKFGPERRAAASVLLRGLAADPTAHADDRVQAAGKLFAYGEPHAATAVLADLAADRTVDADDRLKAAEQLAQWGGEHHERVESALRDLVTDAMIKPTERRNSVQLLAKLNGAAFETVAEAFRSVADDPVVNVAERALALAAAARFDPTARAQAIEAVHSAATDPAVTADKRRELASALMGLDQIGDGTAVMRGIAADRQQEYADRIAAARSLLALVADDCDVAVTVLSEIADDDYADCSDRRMAAWELVTLGGASRAVGSRLLAALATDPRTDVWDRQQAAKHLAKLGDIGLAAKVFCDLLADVDAGERLTAAKDLIWLGFDTAQAAEVLFELVTDPTVEPQTRLDAALTLAPLSSEDCRRLLSYAEAAVVDPAGAPGDRIFAAAVAASLRPEASSLVGTMVEHLADVPRFDSWPTQPAAATLISCGPPFVASAARLLAGAAADPSADASERRAAAQELAKLGERQRSRAAAALHVLADDPAIDGHDRVEAANALGTLGTQHRESAGQILYRIAADPLLDGDDRYDSAQRLLALGPDFRVRGVECLRALLADPVIDYTDWQRAAEGLARLGGTHRQYAGRALRELAADGAQDAWNRRAAAKVLAGLGPEYRPEAIELLLALAADTTTDRGDRVLALAAAGNLDSSHRAEALEALRDFPASHTDAHPVDVRLAARELARYGAHDRAAAARALKAQAADLDADPDDRVAAATDLWEFGADHRGEAAAALHAIARDHRLTPAQRLEAARSFGNQGGRRCRGLAATVLRELAGDQSADSDTRRTAALDLASFGATRGEVAALLQRVVADAVRTTRRRVAHDAAELGADARPTAVAALADLAIETSDLATRLAAANSLRGLGPSARASAAETYADMIGTTGVDPRYRALAAVGLAGTDYQRRRYDAVELLTELATAGTARVLAATLLLELGPLHRTRAGRLLTTIAADSAMRGWERRLAAEALARIAEHRPAASELLAALAREAATDPWERAEAAAAWAEWDPTRPPEALAALDAVVGDAATSAQQRSHAATLLAAFGGPERDAAAATLCTLIQDDVLPIQERARTATALAELGAASEAIVLAIARDLVNGEPSALARCHLHRLIAAHDLSHRFVLAAALTELAQDEAAPHEQRRWAARVLGERGQRHATAARRVLRHLHQTGGNRYESTLAEYSLAELDFGSGVTPPDAATSLLLDTDLTASQRCEAAEAFGRHPATRGTATQVLTDLVRNDALDPDHRLSAASALSRLADGGRRLTTPPRPISD
jgi:uncharacterized protein (UPF0147 family)